MQDVRRKQDVLLGGIAVLSIAALLTKVLSAVYRIPYQNMAGDLGYYVYQQVYPLYGIVTVLAMYGFPVVLSKQRAEMRGDGRNEEARQMTSVLFYGLVVLSIIGWLALMIGAPYVASLMGDEQLAMPISAMSYVLLLLPFLSIGRGYQQSEGELYSTALSHICDQFVRVLFILSVTYVFTQAGYNAYQIGSGAAYGTFIGGIAGIIVLLFLTKAEWIKDLVPPWKIGFGKMLSLNVIVFKQSVYICLSALIFILFQMIDAVSMIRLLHVFGLEGVEAFALKGIYDRGQPLVQLGTILTTTLSLALVPLLSNAVIKGESVVAKNYQQLSYRIALLIGGTATVGLIVIIEPTNHMLFTNTDGTSILTIVVCTIVLNSMFITQSSILQGYNLAYIPATSVAIGCGLKLLFNVLFVPMFGPVGAAWSSLVAMFMILLFGFFVMKRKKSVYIGPIQGYLPILLLIGLMGVITYIWKEGLLYFLPERTRLLDTVVALTSVFIGAIIAGVCLIRFPIFTETEWSYLPKLNKLRRMLVRREG